MTLSTGQSPSQEKTSKLLAPIAALGGAVLSSGQSFFAMVGGMALLGQETLASSVKGIFPPGAKQGRASLIFQMVRVGVKAIPIVVLVQLAIGMILPLQMYPKLSEFGQGDQIATVNAIAAFRELGALMTAIVLSGFAGASIAAELGTMVTSEEIQALRAMALNPVRFLVVPRLVATVIMTVLLTVIADVVMVAGGYLTAMQLGLDSDVFYFTSVDAVNIAGFLSGLIKAAVYGLMIGLIACHQGLSVQAARGSEGVGRATTNTVVYSIVAIIVAAAIFTVIFYAHGVFD
jgi:phospholipid/cholesterol/gamma-HCH transport system permease protein